MFFKRRPVNGPAGIAQSIDDYWKAALKESERIAQFDFPAAVRHHQEAFARRLQMIRQLIHVQTGTVPTYIEVLTPRPCDDHNCRYCVRRV